MTLISFQGPLKDKVNIPLQIKEPSPQDNDSLEGQHFIYPPTAVTTIQAEADPESSSCSRTKRHLLEVTDKISAFTVECSNKVNRCTTWLCTNRNSNGQQHSDDKSFGEIMHPGQSPGSSGSCDDSQPPPKNCYRLVMLG